MPIDVIVGVQRGDEGKGRIVDMKMPEYEIGTRFNGGNNAGHTAIAPNGNVYVLHGLPTSIIHEGAISVIGNGTVIDPQQLIGEIETLRKQDVEINSHKLLISGGAHLTLPNYVQEDINKEKGRQAQGSTKSGISQVYAAKAARVGVRAEIINNDPIELFNVAYENLRMQRLWLGRLARLSDKNDKEIASDFVNAAMRLGPFVTDTVLFINHELRRPKPAMVIAEAAQGFLLDIDHGMYPYTTSSSTIAGGVCTGLGVPPSYIGRVTGVAKAIQSHVGSGPFITEIKDRYLLEQIHGDMSAVDAEKGKTTGRIRRLGYLDLPQIRRAQMINAEADRQDMALTKLNWVPRLGEVAKICVAYFRKGKRLDYAPDAAYKIDQSTPVYVELPTWREDISDVRRFTDLPQPAQNYVELIEKSTGVRISIVGVGPRRDQVILR